MTTNISVATPSEQKPYLWSSCWNRRPHLQVLGCWKSGRYTRCFQHNCLLFFDAHAEMGHSTAQSYIYLHSYILSHTQFNAKLQINGYILNSTVLALKPLLHFHSAAIFNSAPFTHFNSTPAGTASGASLMVPAGTASGSHSPAGTASGTHIAVPAGTASGHS